MTDQDKNSTDHSASTHSLTRVEPTLSAPWHATDQEAESRAGPNSLLPPPLPSAGFEPAQPQRHAIRHWRLWVLVIALALLAVVVCALASLKHERSAVVPPPPPPPVKHLPVVAVRLGAIDDVVTATGKVQLFKYADVTAAVAGQLNSVLVNVGDNVVQGKLLTEIVPNVQAARLEGNRATLARLQADLAGQQAQYEFADLQYKRQSQLKAENATREESFESSRMTLASAAARLDAIKAQIRQTEAGMKDDEETRRRSQVTAPLSGVVVSVSARAGQMVNITPQATPLFRIANLSRMTVEARVAEIDITRLNKGDTVYFTTPGYPGSRWYGHLRQIIPVPADGTGDLGKQTFYNVLFDVDNPGERLLSGMTANASFVLAQKKSVLVAPAQLVTDTDKIGNAQVDVVTRATEPGETDQVLRREVRTGLRNHKLVEIISGLKEGDILLDKPIVSNRPEPPPMIFGDVSAPADTSKHTQPDTAAPAADNSLQPDDQGRNPAAVVAPAHSGDKS